MKKSAKFTVSMLSASVLMTGRRTGTRPEKKEASPDFKSSLSAEASCEEK